MTITLTAGLLCSRVVLLGTFKALVPISDFTILQVS